jgi:hypothetical protein
MSHGRLRVVLRHDSIRMRYSIRVIAQIAESAPPDRSTCQRVSAEPVRMHECSSRSAEGSRSFIQDSRQPLAAPIQRQAFQASCSRTPTVSSYAILTGWSRVTVILCTRNIRGPNRNDFMMAAKIDSLKLEPYNAAMRPARPLVTSMGGLPRARRRRAEF